MKKLNSYIVGLAVVVGVVGVVVFSSEMKAGASCCGSSPEPASLDANAKPDQLTNCPVSGETLGKMGKPFGFIYKAQEVKLCCKGCMKDFDREPTKYISKIRAADKK